MKNSATMIFGGIASAVCFIGSWVSPEYSVAWTANMFFAAAVFVEGYNKYKGE